MTRNLRTSFITLAFATAGFAMLSQGFAASPSTSEVRMLKYCGQLGNPDTTSCRNKPVYKRRLNVALFKEGGGNGTGGGKGGRK